MTVAMFPGTFDPVTNGHLDLIRRSSRIFDKVVVVIFDNPMKKQLFNLDERHHLLEQVTADLDNVEINHFSKTLLIFHARESGANVLIRGVRTIADFEYEAQMTLMNRHLAGDIETVYLTPRAEYTHVASSLVKEVASYGGDISPFVPPEVLNALKEKL